MCHPKLVELLLPFSLSPYPLHLLFFSWAQPHDVSRLPVFVVVEDELVAGADSTPLSLFALLYPITVQFYLHSHSIRFGKPSMYLWMFCTFYHIVKDVGFSWTMIFFGTYSSFSNLPGESISVYSEQVAAYVTAAVVSASSLLSDRPMLSLLP